MERFNPFAADSSLANDPDPFSANPIRCQSSTGATKNKPLTGATRTDQPSATTTTSTTATGPSKLTMTSRYSTTFPDPFGDDHFSPSSMSAEKQAGDHISTGTTSQPTKAPAPPPPPPPPPPPLPPVSQQLPASPPTANRSYSVTFSNGPSSDETTSSGSPVSRRATSRQASGLSSFLSRATSVTSSSVTDRVTGAVGSVRSAVDSLSNQIQQAVPSNLNERLSSTATNIIGTGSVSVDSAQTQQQQTTASYLASKLSSATTTLTSTSPGSSSMPIICRQRVVLILDSFASTDWPQQFNQYRRFVSGLSTTSSAQSAITSFFSSATAPFSSTISQADGADLIEQADFNDVSVLANQSSSTAAIYITNASNSTNARAPSAKIIRPEYVVVRQRTREKSSHLNEIVKAINYCLVPMFEPYEVWTYFQDRQLIFSKLLRIQRTIGKENFPLIPQIYCQTHQDLTNYINSSSISLPCLVRTGPQGKGKIKIDNLQMLRDFTSIMATSGQSCTIEQYLDVKCDLIVEKLGTSLKCFKRNVQKSDQNVSSTSMWNVSQLDDGGRVREQQSFMSSSSSSTRQSTTRQTSLGSGVLSSLISTTTGQQQQLNRRSSNPSSISGRAFERLSEVSVRYKNWMDAVAVEFDHKIDAFCLKIAVTTNDREYIVGLRNCSMDFVGSQENQDEDRRSFVELILSNMNTILPKRSPASRETSQNLSGGENVGVGSGGSIGQLVGRKGSNEDGKISTPLTDKNKTFSSQSDIINGGINQLHRDPSASGTVRGYGQLNNRSKSVSINQCDFKHTNDGSAIINKSVYLPRRGSERSESLTNDDLSVGGTAGSLLSQREGSMGSQSSGLGAAGGSGSGGGLHQRQASLGQSIFDQTSTAFSSFQKQSMSFFKRLDSRAGEVSSTPPQSAKSDIGFDRGFAAATANPLNNNRDLNINRTDGVKSQSMDSSTIDRSLKSSQSLRRETPPKPPPPPSMMNRQSSLASYSSSDHRARSDATTPHTTPNQTRQNSTMSSVDSYEDTSNQRNKVVRQNSALSAFEPFDPDLRSANKANEGDDGGRALRGDPVSSTSIVSDNSRLHQEPSSNGGAKRGSNVDINSTPSGYSTSVDETTTAEDTMNNLKKTFASIFGDKCE